ncbi:hypothetical protein YKV098 [Yokapox virus]|uniref:Uncharacterized protein n=1 Tax=Yokapox virus TaxID=1076255 RepID=G3EIH6_9POXV|nr:hypothetical protein YKV098 [Yokapox virus]AEN03687.1 unknown [Yokapox virus]
MTFVDNNTYSTFRIYSLDVSKKFIFKILIIIINKYTIFCYFRCVSKYSIHPWIFN